MRCDVRRGVRVTRREDGGSGAADPDGRLSGRQCRGLRPPARRARVRSQGVSHVADARFHARGRSAAGDVPPDASRARGSHAGRAGQAVGVRDREARVPDGRARRRAPRSVTSSEHRAAASTAVGSPARSARSPARAAAASNRRCGRCRRTDAARSCCITCSDFRSRKWRRSWGSSLAPRRFDRAARPASCGRCCERNVMSSLTIDVTSESYREAIVSDLAPVRPLTKPSRRVWLLVPIGLLLAATAPFVNGIRGDLSFRTRRSSRGARPVFRRCSDCGCSRSVSAKRSPAATCRAHRSRSPPD